MRNRRIAKAAIVFSAVVLACVLAGAASSGKNESEGSAPRMETRCYNVADLSDIGLPTSVRSGAPKFMNVPAGYRGSLGSSDRAVSTDIVESGGIDPGALVEMVKRLVKHESSAAIAVWSEEGGSADVEWAGELLVISQTAEAHKQIEELLTLLRKDFFFSVNVGIRANWIQVDQAVARQLLNSKPAPQTVDLEALRKAGAHILCAGQVTARNRQRVWLFASRAESVVQDAAKSEEDSKGLIPVIGTLPSGASLEATPIIQKQGKTARIVLYSQFVGLGEEAGPLLKVGADVDGQHPIEISHRPEFHHEFVSTVELPVGKPTIVAGTSLLPGEVEGKVLYLVLTVDLSP